MKSLKRRIYTINKEGIWHSCEYAPLSHFKVIGIHHKVRDNIKIISELFEETP